MKKIVSLFLILIILLTAAPVTAFSAEGAPAVSESDTVTPAGEESEALFEPMTVCGSEVFQAGQPLDTVVKDGTLMVDAEAFAGAAADPVTGEVTFSEEAFSVAMTAGSDEALVITPDGEECFTLEAPLTQSDDTLYAPLEDMASLCHMEVTQSGDCTVYAKPFQTKNLIARGSRIPACGEVSREKLDGGYTLLHFDTEDDTREAYTVLSDTKTVSEVSGENVYSLCAPTEADFALGENLSWGADYIDSPQLTEYAKEQHIQETVTVGIVDTGINTSHSLLKNRIDGKSHSCVPSEPSVEDAEGHGSHVAGIVADNTPDNVKILAVKGLNKEGQGTDSNLAAAIRYAADNGADVINMSFGGPTSAVGSILKNAVKYAYDKGVILVVAAGNENTDAKRSFPAASPYCITVAATDSDGDPAYFSNYGETVDVAAPGVSIYSAYKDEGVADAYIRESGTSMASPFTAAACADALLLNGKMTPDRMKEYIKGKVTPYGESNKYYGTGIISLTDYIGVKRGKPVVFSALSGSYADALTVKLTCADAGAAIYYTTDGSSPDRENGTRYTAPLTVSDNTEIKAVAYSGSFYKSKTTKASYRFNAYDFDSSFIVDENGVITAYRGTMEDLCVQDVIGGKRITGISSTAFRDNVVVNLKLPDAVKAIPDSAFINCDMLESIVARGVTRVGNNAFYNCHLETTAFGALESVGKYAFYGNVNLSDDGIDISRLTEIPDYAFYKCGITLLHNDRVTAVGKNAFAYTNLLVAALPAVKTVGEGAFGQCRVLESIDLPSAEVLAKNAFRNCHKLARFTGDRLTKIGDAAFESCYPLSELHTSLVTEIGQKAFTGTAITSLDLPLVTVLPEYAFYYMQRLTSLNIGNIRTVPVGAFQHTEALSAVPDGVKNAVTVEREAFRFSGITDVNLPRAVTVKENAFSDCPAVASVSLPQCVEFGKMSAMGGSQFTSLTLPRVIAFGAVEGSAYLESVSLPLAASVGASAFKDCVRLRYVTAPNNEILPTNAFMNCRSLEYTELSSVKGQLGAHCFENCAALKEISLPLVTDMAGGSTFRDCASLEWIDLSSAETVGSVQDDFYGCESLRYIISPKATQVKGIELYHCYALREWNLPACTSLSFAAYNSVNANRNMDFIADVSIHAPNAETITFRHDTTYLSGYAIPTGVQSVSMNKKNTQTAKTLAFYAADGVTDAIGEGVNYEMHPSPALADDLPTSYTLTQNGEPLTVRAFCADPVYTWYYAANGNSYQAVTGAHTNRLYPDKAGSYYCRVTENGTQSSVNSAVCHVTAAPTAVLTNRTGTALNLLCNGVLFEGLADGNSLTVPKGAAIRVLCNGAFYTLKAGNTALTASPNTYDFTAGDNTVLTAGREIALKNAEVKLGMATRVYYTGKPIVPHPEVTVNGKTLKEGTDYTVAVFNNVEGGTATATITGIAPYVGVRSLSFTIAPESLASCTVVPIPDYVYTGSAVTPPVTLKINGVTVTDYHITGYKNNVNVGTATVTVVGGGVSLTGVRNITFRITAAKQGWVKDGGKTYYYYADGTFAKGWQTIGGKKYLFAYADGRMLTGWYKSGKNKFYFGTDGVLRTGWQNIDGKKYLFAYADGRMLTGWYKSGKNKYYFGSDGAMRTGWQNIDGKKYLFAYADGRMLTGWYKSGKYKYYFGSDGAMRTGWQTIGGKRYLFAYANGRMLTGWYKSGKNKYYFGADGAMVVNRSLKIGSKTYQFNKYGVCTNP